MNKRSILLAMCGASGAMYGLRLARELVRAGHELTLCLTPSGELVCREESGLDPGGETLAAASRIRAHLELERDIRVVRHDDLMCRSASGSAAPDAMVICPCSMGTLGRIAAGISGNLVERSADVMLKEDRPLLLVPRETPLSIIHLENLLRLARAGARIIPAMPAFYHKPETMDDLVNFVVGKVLDQLGVANALYRRWNG